MRFSTGKVFWLVLLGLLGTGASARALTIGDPVPDLAFTDIEGLSATNSGYSGWVQVLTVADRESSEKMSEWMNETGIEVAKKYPGLRIAYIGFADMQVVPRFMRPVAEPILRQFNRRSQKQQAALYDKAGVKVDATRTALHVVPDWDGGFLKKLGVSDATVWRCWIVIDGKVVEAIDGNTRDGAARYLAAMGRAAESSSRMSAVN